MDRDGSGAARMARNRGRPRPVAVHQSRQTANRQLQDCHRAPLAVSPSRAVGRFAIARRWPFRHRAPLAVSPSRAVGALRGDAGSAAQAGGPLAERRPASNSHRRRGRISPALIPSLSSQADLPMSRNRFVLTFAAAFAAAPISRALHAQTRMLRSPTVSDSKIAFAYANNVWVVDKSGGNARRLTSGPGGASNPKFSPDGKLIAFSADYGGNTDVYVVPADGGEPKRLTWHPGADNVQGWTPDGKNIVFASSRASQAPSAVPRFWTVPVEGGVETPMPLPRAYQGKISPDGKYIAYRMNNSWDEERRNYRGGQNRPIWIVDLKTFDLDSTPNMASDLVVAQAGSPRSSAHFTATKTPESKNMDPVWVNNNVIDFISDRDGVANVWSYDKSSKKLTQVTDFSDYDTKTLDAAFDGSSVVFEQAGYIHLLDPKTGKEHIVNITATGDFPWMMGQWKDVTANLANIALSPTGKRVAVEARGEIFTIPATQGDVRDITNSSGSAEREPAWSPDGKQISYFSDKSGEYELYIVDQDGLTTPREIKIPTTGHFYTAAWSPDGKKIMFHDT